MLQSSLTHTDEHLAWKQRVRKELGNTQKFYNVALKHVEGDTGFSSSKMLRPYVRHNRDHFVTKTTPYYMLDSTYLVASDPNSMRDNGPCRNAEYVFNPGDGHARPVTGDRLMRTWSTIRDSKPQQRGNNNAVYSVVRNRNKGLYGFGGTTKIGAALEHVRNE